MRKLLSSCFCIQSKVWHFRAHISKFAWKQFCGVSSFYYQLSTERRVIFPFGLIMPTVDPPITLLTLLTNLDFAVRLDARIYNDMLKTRYKFLTVFCRRDSLGQKEESNIFWVQYQISVLEFQKKGLRWAIVGWGVSQLSFILQSYHLNYIFTNLIHYLIFLLV